MCQESVLLLIKERNIYVTWHLGTRGDGWINGGTEKLIGRDT